MATAAVRGAKLRQSDDDFVRFAAAGERCVGDRCIESGYGIVSRRTLPTCPMCRGESWEDSPWRPRSRGRER